MNETRAPRIGAAAGRPTWASGHGPVTLFDQPGAFDAARGGRSERTRSIRLRRRPRRAPSSVRAVGRCPTGRSLESHRDRADTAAAGSGVFGGLRIYASVTEARDCASPRDAPNSCPTSSSYMAALENALVATSAGGDPPGGHYSTTATTQLAAAARRHRFAARRPAGGHHAARLRQGPDGQGHLEPIDLRQEVITIAPLLLTAETAITGSVRVDDETLRQRPKGCPARSAPAARWRCSGCWSSAAGICPSRAALVDDRPGRIPSRRR